MAAATTATFRCLSVWAHAPLMHNNAIGPEICGKPQNKGNYFYRSPYVDRERQDAACRQGAGLLGVRPERRRPLQAVRRLDGGSAEPGRNACPRSHASTGRARSRWARASGMAKEEKQVIGFTVVLPEGTSVGGAGELPAQGVRQRSRPREAQAGGLDAKLVKQFGEKEGKEVAADAARGHERDRQGSGEPGRNDPPSIRSCSRSTARAPRTSRTRAIGSARICPTPTRRR